MKPVDDDPMMVPRYATSIRLERERTNLLRGVVENVVLNLPDDDHAQGMTSSQLLSCIRVAKDILQTVLTDTKRD